MEGIDRISWIVTSPVETACRYEGGESVPVPDSVLNIDLHPKPGDRIALFGAFRDADLTVPFEGTTVRDFMKSIERGMQQPVRGEQARAYAQQMGLNPRKIPELTNADFVGDHCFFEGHLHRQPNGV